MGNCTSTPLVGEKKRPKRRRRAASKRREEKRTAANQDSPGGESPHDASHQHPPHHADNVLEDSYGEEKGLTPPPQQQQPDHDRRREFCIDEPRKASHGSHGRGRNKQYGGCPPLPPIALQTYQSQPYSQTTYDPTEFDPIAEDPRRASRDARRRLRPPLPVEQNIHPQILSRVDQAQNQGRNGRSTRRPSADASMSSGAASNDSHFQFGSLSDNTGSMTDGSMQASSTDGGSTVTGNFSLGMDSSIAATTSTANTGREGLSQVQLLQNHKLQQSRLRLQRRGRTNDALLKRRPSSAVGRSSRNASVSNGNFSPSTGGGAMCDSVSNRLEDEELLSMLGAGSLSLGKSANSSSGHNNLGEAGASQDDVLDDEASSPESSQQRSSGSSNLSRSDSSLLTPSQAALRDATLHQEGTSAALHNPLLADYGEWEDEENASVEPDHDNFERSGSLEGGCDSTAEVQGRGGGGTSPGGDNLDFFIGDDENDEEEGCQEEEGERVDFFAGQ